MLSGAASVRFVVVILVPKAIETLTDEQQELLERYSVANNITVALTERLAYQQGMRDFLNLFISLLKG